MLDRLRDVVATLRPHKRESDSPYDGPFSVYREYHALTLGLGAGVIAGATGTWELAIAVSGVALGVRAVPTGALKQIRKDPWYTIGGVVLGWLLALAVA